MLNIFNLIANLASGTLTVATAVSSAAPQLSAESHRQATLDLAGVALLSAGRVAAVGAGNPWVLLGSQLLPAIYEEVMLAVNKHGLIAGSISQSPQPSA